MAIEVRELTWEDKKDFGCVRNNPCHLVSDGENHYHVTTFEQIPNPYTMAKPSASNGNPYGYKTTHPTWWGERGYPNQGLGIQNAILMLNEISSNGEQKTQNESGRNSEDVSQESEETYEDLDDTDRDGYEKCPPGACGACDNEELSCRNPHNPETGDGEIDPIDCECPSCREQRRERASEALRNMSLDDVVRDAFDEVINDREQGRLGGQGTVYTKLPSAHDPRACREQRDDRYTGGCACGCRICLTGVHGG